MNIVYDRYNQPIQSHVYLGTPNNKILCAINGIEESTFQLTSKFINTYELTFNINEKILIEDEHGLSKLVHSNVYDLVAWLMRVYVDNVGWFIMDAPKISHDGIKETKTITCHSAEIEMEQHDLKNFKINQGTTDSYEMLADDNVEKIDDVEFAKEQIKFYNPDNPQLSLLDLVLRAGNVYGWTIGEIDTVPKTYRTYRDGKYVETYTLLSDEIGSFDIESQDVYSFFTQDMAQYFQCIFVFDFLHMKINAYHPENYGNSTNININFKNLQQSQEISVDDSKMFTRYYVQGSDNLGITYVNFGSNYIENIDYYLNEKYFSSAFIQKYNLWKQDAENCRIDYIEATRKYNQQMKVITELYDRVPLDDCSTNWSTFTDDELKEAQANYQAQLKGYEQFYVDSNGNFDEDALKKSSDANDYYQIRDVILPSIQIEMNNRQLPTDDDNADYVDSYKTNWKLYGLDELKVKLQEYKNTVETCKKGGYDKPYSEDSSHTKDIHDKMYAKYLDAQNQLDSNYVGGCQEAYAQRQSEIDAANDVLNTYSKERLELTKKVNKETWTHQNNNYLVDEKSNCIIDAKNQKIASPSDTISFTEKDLLELSKVYYDGTYSNDNMFLTDSDDQVSAIDEQLKLFNTASDDLYISSHPQYQYITSLDNFLAKSEYKDYTKNINRGDYLYLTIGDNNVVKLRLIEMTYNPLMMDNNIELTFSNMTRTKNGFFDLPYLLDNSSGGSKSSASGSSNNFLNNEGVTLTSGLIQKLLSSGAFSNKVSSIINNEFAGMLGSGSISLQELNAKLIKVTDLYGENGYFEYLQSKLISADKIVAGSGNFKELSAVVAAIDSLLAGNISAELGHLIHLTASNVVVDDAVIRDLIAANITVAMLKASTISADKFNIASDDGGLTIVGNTMQFKDKNNNVRIQIGRDAKDNFTFTLYDETGKGVLIDSKGIKESAIADGLIKNDMVADGTLSKDKLNFNVIEADKNGNVDAAKVIVNGHGVDAEFTSIKQQITDQIENVEGKIGTLDLYGEQIFRKIDGVISPNNITITAKYRNDVKIGKWYIDNVENTRYVSTDKTSIIIPSSYIATLPSTKKSLVIKVEDSTKKLYDVLTVHILDSLNGVDGQPSISVIITSEKGVVFDDDTTITSTICTCQVYKGATPMEPIFYKWQIINNESGDWKTVGNNKTLTINVDKSIIRKRIRCLVDIGDVAQVSITDEQSNTLQDENGISLYSIEAASDTSASSKNIIDVNTTEVLDSSDSVFVNSGKSLKQINYDLLADAILNKLLSKSYEKIGTNVIDAIKENANTLTDKDIDTLIEKM
ncbi:hypothetical protein DWX00_15745 [Blautia sp. AF17-9LB]|uniref:hypothetical protein n=1 Tax=Blautia sp. AF17-9LB TaxID=2292959 RepID=UPI000E4F42E1|nr:hypothetical protein [Blautia sp. AF17-9LB]RHR47407.1 hypothetical protein DWX00_15745 [Blautia sp. AF17-9LB]